MGAFAMKSLSWSLSLGVGFFCRLSAGDTSTPSSFKIRLRAIKAEFGIEHAQPKHVGIVQGQPFDRRSAARGLADDFKRDINGPLKMVVPILRARMEQRHNFAGDAVSSIDVVQLGAITNRTSVGQVFQRCRPASAERLNVVQFKSADLKPTGQQAVFAPFASSLNDGVAK